MEIQSPPRKSMVMAIDFSSTKSIFGGKLSAILSGGNKTRRRESVAMGGCFPPVSPCRPLQEGHPLYEVGFLVTRKMSGADSFLEENSQISTPRSSMSSPYDPYSGNNPSETHLHLPSKATLTPRELAEAEEEYRFGRKISVGC